MRGRLGYDATACYFMLRVGRVEVDSLATATAFLFLAALLFTLRSNRSGRLRQRDRLPPKADIAERDCHVGFGQ